VLALAALLVATLDGSAATGKRVLQRTTAGEIESLAVDGTRIAYDVGSYGAKCNRVYVWNVATGITTRVSGSETCRADASSTGAGVRELAIAGKRVGWIVNQGGNTESDDYLYTAALPRPKVRRLATAVRTGDVSGILTGSWIGGLVGAGSFLAVDRWATDSGGKVASARLQRIGTGLRTLASGPATLEAQSTDGKEVAVLRLDNTVGLYSAQGKLLRTVKPASVTEVAVRGDYLAVLTTASTLEVYNSHSGRHLHTWRVAQGARSLDVSSGLAAYAAPRAGGGYARVVHVLRLSNGRDHVLATTPPQLVAVRLEPAGLVYAVERIGPSGPGKIVFVPMSRLPH
jgi:WD40 repeat protein